MRSPIPSDTSIHCMLPADVASQRRGIALMLVVVTLATATILTTSFLVSSENTPEIGQAAQDRVTSEWSAQSTATLIEAAMETTADWRTLAASGLVLSDKAMLGADVSVAMTNLGGTVAGDDDGYVLLTVIAKVGGIESVVQRVLSERDLGTYEEALDPELNEFGVFAAARLTVQSGSRIAPWGASPVAKTGDPAKLGVGFTSSASISTSLNALSQDVHMFLPPTASAALESSLASFNVDTSRLPVSMWNTTAETPVSLTATMPTLPFGMMPMTTIPILIDMPLLSAEYTVPVLIENGRTVLFDGSSGVFYFSSEGAPEGGLRIDSSTLRIQGDVVIGVYDTFRIRSSVIELVDDATLTIYHANNVLIEDSVIGAAPELLANATRSYEDLSQWIDPRRVRFIQLNRNADPSVDRISIRERSIVVGSFHAPGARMRIRENSVVAGRVSVDELQLTDNSAILADPVFDNKLGLSEPDSSPLYDVNGDLVGGLLEAMESTTTAEGFASAMSRVLGAMPTQAIPADTPVNGANRRYAGTVRRMREWPVRVRLQEQDSDINIFFDVPRDEIIAAAFGDDMLDELEHIEEEENGTVPTDGGEGGGGGGGGCRSSICQICHESSSQHHH